MLGAEEGVRKHILERGEGSVSEVKSELLSGYKGEKMHSRYKSSWFLGLRA